MWFQEEGSQIHTDLFQPPWANNNQSVLTTWKLKTIQKASVADLNKGLKLGWNLKFLQEKLCGKFPHNTDCPRSVLTFSNIGTID